MESTTGKRLKHLRIQKGLDVEGFAKVLGVKASAVYGLEKDANKPSFETIANLTTAFPDLNLDWLINGTGPMLRDGRVLTPAERPATTAAPVTQVPQMQVVPESELVKELKEDRNYWREMALGLMSRDQAESGKKLLPDSYSAAEELPIAPAGFGEGRGGRYAARTTMQVGARAYAFEGSELLVIGMAEQDQEAA